MLYDILKGYMIIKKSLDVWKFIRIYDGNE